MSLDPSADPAKGFNPRPTFYPRLGLAFGVGACSTKCSKWNGGGGGSSDGLNAVDVILLGLKGAVLDLELKEETQHKVPDPRRLKVLQCCVSLSVATPQVWD